MSYMRITEAGLSAISNAEAGGFKVNCVAFETSSSDIGDVENNPSLALRTSLVGTPNYRGQVGAIEVHTDSTVSYELVLESEFPATGDSIAVREVGLFLDNGVLFAIGSVSPTIRKERGTSLHLKAYVAAAKQGATIDVTVNDKTSLPKQSINNLSDAKTSKANTVAVTGLKPSIEHSGNQVSIVVTSGVGNEEWGILGYTRVGSGLKVRPLSETSFSLDPNTNGFWLNDGESVVVQVLRGKSEGTVRTYTYRKQLVSASHVFETDLALTLDNSSEVSIWKSDKNYQPDRRGVPSSHVLFAGDNTHSGTWDTSAPVQGTLSIATAYFQGLKNQYQFDLPQDLPQTYLDKNNLLVFINGVLLGFNDYNVYDQKLIVSPLLNGASVSVYLFYRSSNQGSSFNFYTETIEQAKLVDYGGKPSYDMPIIVKDNDHSLGFTFSGGLAYEVQRNWGFDGAKLVYPQSPNADTLMLVWANTDKVNGYSQPQQYEWSYNQNNSDSATDTHVFKLADTPEAGTHLLFVKGHPVTPNLYRFDGQNLIIKKSDLTIVDGDLVRLVWIFNKFSNLTYNRGQVKADADLVPLVPNKVEARVASYISPKNEYLAKGVPINDNNILVFVHGIRQERGKHWNLNGANRVSFTFNVPSGYPVDILSFSEVALDPNSKGFTLMNEVFTINTDGQNFKFNVPQFNYTEDSVIAFVDGLYLHKSEYSAVPNSNGQGFELVLVSTLPPDCQIEVIKFGGYEAEQSRTELLIDKPLPHIGFQRFMTTKPSTQANTLLFIGGLYQHKDDYQFKGNEVVLNRSVPYSSVGDQEGYSNLNVELLSLVTGKDLEAVNSDMSRYASSAKPATNTGPYWADPAGLNRSPNRIHSSIASFTSGAKTKYVFTPPYNSDSIKVFLSGALQEPERDFVFLSLGQIAFTSKIPSGYPVDIITYQVEDDSYGYELDIKVFEVVSNTRNNYVVKHKLESEQDLMVFVSGAYFHKSWYKVVTSNNQFSIQFNDALLADLTVEICIWNSKPSQGSYTELFVQKPSPTIGAKSVVLEDEVVKRNTFVFAGPIYQAKSSYAVTKQNLVLDEPVNYADVDPINLKDMPVIIYGFRTGAAQSRLVTRDELRQNYLSKHGGEVNGPIYVNSEPESENELVNKAYVDQLGKQIELMQELISGLQGGSGSEFDLQYSPVLTVSPNLIKVGDSLILKIANASPGKRVELEVRGSSGVYNERSIKGVTRLDGTFSIGPVGVDAGYSDFLTVTAWVDGFMVANTVDIKVVDTNQSQQGPTMIASDKPIYAPFDYIVYSLADAVPNGKVTWAINGAEPTGVPSGQPQTVEADGTWSMQVPAGGTPANYMVEIFVDSVSVGTLNIVVSPNRNEVLPVLTYSASEIFRDEVFEVKISDAKPHTPVVFSAKAIGVPKSGPQETVGLVQSDGSLNFGLRFTSAGQYIAYIKIGTNLFTTSLDVKQVSPNDKLIGEQPDGYRAYIKQF